METAVRGVKEFTDTFLFSALYFWTGYAFGSVIDLIHVPALEGEKEDDTARVYSEARLVLNLLVQLTLISFVYYYGRMGLCTLENPLWQFIRTRDAATYDSRFFHPLHFGLFFSLGLVWAAHNMQRQVDALARTL